MRVPILQKINWFLRKRYLIGFHITVFQSKQCRHYFRDTRRIKRTVCIFCIQHCAAVNIHADRRLAIRRGTLRPSRQTVRFYLDCPGPLLQYFLIGLNLCGKIYIQPIHFSLIRSVWGLNRIRCHYLYSHTWNQQCNYNYSGKKSFYFHAPSSYFLYFSTCSRIISISSK